MDTKKIMAVMVVMIMAATSVSMLPFGDGSEADTALDSSPSYGSLDIPELIDLEIGEVMGIEYAKSYSMDTVLEKMGPVMKTLIDELAHSFGVTTGLLVSMLEKLGYEKTAAFIQKIIDNPQGVKITKNDLIIVLNDALKSTGATVKDFNLGMAWDMVGGLERVSQTEYKDLSTVNAEIQLALDLTSTSSSVPSIYLKDAKIAIKAIEDTTIKFDVCDSGITSRVSFELSFTGVSNFINDQAATFKEMFKTQSENKNFNINLSADAGASVRIATADGFVLPTELDERKETSINMNGAAYLSASSTNTAIQEAVKSIGTQWTDNKSFPCVIVYTNDEDFGKHYEIAFYTEGETSEESQIVGTLCAGTYNYGLMVNYKGVVLTASIDVKNFDIDIYLNIKDVEVEAQPMAGLDVTKLLNFDINSIPISEMAIVINENTFKIDSDLVSLDLSSFMKQIQTEDVKYGEKYILTDNEIKALDNDLSKTAYKLNFDAVGFTGENINVEPKEEPKFNIDQNLLIILIVVIVLIIAIVALVLVKKKHH